MSAKRVLRLERRENKGIGFPVNGFRRENVWQPHGNRGRLTTKSFEGEADKEKAPR